MWVDIRGNGLIWKLCLLITGNAVLLFVSRKSLQSPLSHGFSRFFAWEVILLLFLLNVTTWFVRPFALHQIISWVLLLFSIVPVSCGILLLNRYGKPTAVRKEDDKLMGFEKTTMLVTEGIYRYIRHPLYSSLILLAWGIFFKSPSWAGGSLAITASGFLYLTAIRDERECLEFFGEEYARYIEHTKRFIPFIF